MIHSKLTSRRKHIKNSQLGDIEKKYPDPTLQEGDTSLIRQGVICLYFKGVICLYTKRSDIVGDPSERSNVANTSITEASMEWTGCSPSGWRPPRYVPCGRLTADQMPLLCTTSLFCTTAIIAGENPAADPKAKSWQLSRKPYDARLYNSGP